MAYKREPHWHTELLYSPVQLPRAAASKVLIRGSLTAYLHSLCQKEFRVEVLQQRWELPLGSEARALNLQSGVRAQIREVLLYVDEKPLIFGRTIVPKNSFDRIGRPLQRLGRTPLGVMLFKSPHLKRTPFQWARVEAGDLIHQRIFPHVFNLPTALWGRRSTFIYHEVPLLLTEVFLETNELSPKSCLIDSSTDSHHPHVHAAAAIRGAHARRRVAR